MLQAQEHITALHNACQQLDSTATGKAAETRLQKALDKLHKIQQATAPGETAATLAGGSQPMAVESRPSAQAATTNAETGSGTRQQGEPAMLTGSSQPQPDQIASNTDVEMTLADQCDSAADQRGSAPMQQETIMQEAAVEGHLQPPGSSSQVDKEKVLAEKKAQKEEAKVTS